MNWHAELMASLKDPQRLRELAEKAKLEAPVDYQPSTPRMDGYTSLPRFDYKMRQIGEDDE